MAIQRHNIVFAAKRTLWLLPIVVLLIVLWFLRCGTLLDLAWGLAPLTILGLGYFGYRLWRTQQRLPSPDRERSYPFRDSDL
jgi:hypothetical protein